MRAMALAVVSSVVLLAVAPAQARTCTEQSKKSLQICETDNANAAAPDRIDCKQRMAAKLRDCLATGNWAGNSTRAQTGTFERR